MADLRLCKKDGKKLYYDEAVAMMERLAYYQQKSEEFLQAEAPIKAYMGEAYQGIETPWDYVTEQMEALQAELEEKEHTVSVGGGAVQVVMTGKKELKALTIKPEVVDPEDIEMLQDLVISAVNEVIREIEDESAKEMEKISGGLSVPGLF